LYFRLEATEKVKKRMRTELPARSVSIGFSDELFGDTTPRLTAARAHMKKAPWLKAERKLHRELRSNASGISNVPLRTLPDTYFMAMWRFRQQELWPHPSWFGERAMAWLKTPIEMFRPELAKGHDIIIDLDDFRDASPCSPGAKGKVAAALENQQRD